MSTTSPDVDHLTIDPARAAPGARALGHSQTHGPRDARVTDMRRGTHWPNVALLGTELAHSARVRTIKHRRERWVPLDRPPRAALAAAKERLWRTYNQPLWCATTYTHKRDSVRVPGLYLVLADDWVPQVCLL